MERHSRAADALEAHTRHALKRPKQKRAAEAALVIKQSPEHIPAGHARSHAARSVKSEMRLNPLTYTEVQSRCSNAQWNMTMRWS